MFALSCRCVAGGKRGMGVKAGPTGHLPETTGNGPGVCSRQEGGAGLVRIITHMLTYRGSWSPNFMADY